MAGAHNAGPFCLTGIVGMKHAKADRYGVFAGAAIPTGRKVMIYAGEKIRFREAARRAVKLAKSRTARTYLARINRHWVMDGAVRGNGAERINHCCDPNVRFRRTAGRIEVYSRRTIRKGEELTLDYRFREENEKIACHCGSPKCRGYMNRRLKT